MKTLADEVLYYLPVDEVHDLKQLISELVVVVMTYCVSSHSHLTADSYCGVAFAMMACC